MNNVELEMKLLRFIFILICLSCLIQARKKSLQKKMVDYKHKRFKRFLGGSKTTTNSTTTTALSPTLNTKTTKFTGNNNFSKLMTQLQSESFNNGASSPAAKDQGKLYLALQPYNKPLEANSNGLSSPSVLPLYYTLPTTRTSSESSKHENTWPLFQFQGNEGGGVSLKMFYDRNGDGQNQLSTINNVTTFSNNAIDQNIEDDMLISHNLDPSVKYTSMTAPNVEETLPPINYVGYLTNPQETFTKNPYYTSPSDLHVVENKPDYSITETRNVQNEMSLSNDKSENVQYPTPNTLYNVPQTNLNGFENEPGYKNEIGFIGHNNFREEPKSYLGYQNDLYSEGSFDSALNRHTESNQNNLEEKNGNVNAISLRENPVQDGSRFLDNMDQYGRYLRSSNHNRGGVFSKKAKHKR
ncbi:uncharacterized protein [Onthophagus taurus]|uniref:uncharacterized protein isoform X3 n=1 Tax=Onthophagus taurus TaxID=166361 RepID=UPI0039BDEFBC